MHHANLDRQQSKGGAVLKVTLDRKLLYDVLNVVEELVRDDVVVVVVEKLRPQNGCPLHQVERVDRMSNVVESFLK